MLSLRMVRIPHKVAAFVVDGREEARAILDAEEEESGQWFSLANAWAAIHFVISGEPPLAKDEVIAAGLTFHEDQKANILMGGSATGLASDYGAVRYLTPGEVRKNWSMLSPIDEKRFRELYAPADLDSEDIAPYGWSENPGREEILLETFAELREFYRDAVHDGHAMVIEFVPDDD